MVNRIKQNNKTQRPEKFAQTSLFPPVIIHSSVIIYEVLLEIQTSFGLCTGPYMTLYTLFGSLVIKENTLNLLLLAPCMQ